MALVLACGSANDGTKPGGAAGSSTAGGGNWSVGGNGALGGQSGAAGNALSGSGGLAGAGGTASGGSAGSTAAAFDPTVSIPSHDCRADTSPNCISVAGTYNGAAVDTYCNMNNDLGVIIQGGKWAIGCEHLMPGFARLFIPVARPGNFSEQLSVGPHPKIEFYFKSDASPFGSVVLGVDNFQHAEAAWSITAAPSNYRLVSGTFHGKWAIPDSACGSSSGVTCAEADVNVSFRLESEYGYCFADTDCAAPRVCNPIAFACYD